MISSNQLPATRWGAFFGHILISLGILVALSLLIAFVMFPGALFSLAGGTDGIKIIAGVDLVLGPVLTLVIYNRNKPLKELFRDLAIIGFIQLAALSAGMYLVHKSRPAAVTYAYDMFHVVRAADFDIDESSRPDDLNWLSPKYYNVKLPDDSDEALSKMVEFEFSGVPAQLHTELYEALAREPDALAQQLRLDQKKPETIDQECIVRTVNSVFDSADVCFNPKTFRLTKIRATPEGD